MPAGRDEPGDLVEERDHVRVRNEVEGFVCVRERRRVGPLEADPARNLVGQLAPRLFEHPVGEIRTDDVCLRKSARDRQRAVAGAGADVERMRRRLRQCLERLLVRRQVIRTPDLVPARRQGLELAPHDAAKQPPEPRAGDDGIRRQTRELTAERLSVHEASR